MRYLVAAAIMLLPLLDLGWNLTHLSSGLPDIFGLLAFARGLVENGAWPGTPYFPAGYPLLLIPFGLAGNALLGGYLLSAGGLMLALWALYRLVRVFDGPRWLGLTAVVCGWLLPVYRLPAGSPSVDALFTGLGLWFLAAVIALWRQGTRPDSAAEDAAAGDQLAALTARELAPWVGWGLVVPVIVMPLLRYHAAILLLPVLLVLTLWRPRVRRVLLWPWVGLICVLAFNFLSWYAAWGEPMPSVVGIQMRCGLEFAYRVNYENPEYMYLDYIGMCEHARRSSVIADYGWPLVARHTLRSLYLYMRRPPMVLLLGLAFLTLLIRRRFPAGAGILALWAVLYCLALSPAYYTPRGALLPALAAVGLSLVLATWLAARCHIVWAGLAAAVLLLIGMSQAARYARLVFIERNHFAQLSRQFDDLMREREWSNDEVIVTDVRVIPLRGNPWGLPFAHTEMFWTDDPAVRPEQTPGIVRLAQESVAAGPPGYRVLLFKRNHPRADEMQELLASPQWTPLTEIEEMLVLVRSEQASADGA